MKTTMMTLRVSDPPGQPTSEGAEGPREPETSRPAGGAGPYGLACATEVKINTALENLVLIATFSEFPSCS